MVLGRIATHDQHHVGVLDVDPAVRHCAASEGGPQTGDRGPVSNPGLRFEVADAHAAHGFYRKIVQLIGISTTACPGNSFAAINRKTALVLFNKSFVASFLDPAADVPNRIVPGNIFPMIRPGPPDLWLRQSAFVDYVLLE